ncbi:hypothetical protein [Streptomyces malaysiense]|uniref:Uncharacterized protein n=1 Tax=Streptomyces malaysiense TaxID=1428626 RepID=A0A1J4PYU8_9ACTN|nr:hypothetical protein [Streptomyces malaysiense]OIK25468.1 hypothetical protein VT52_021600 [Streptomyces malaysiense]
MRGRAGDFFECGADGLGDQLQTGQVAHRGQDVGGTGALRGALADETGLLQAREREVEKTVGSAALGETVTEIGQHAVIGTGAKGQRAPRQLRRSELPERQLILSEGLCGPSIW